MPEKFMSRQWSSQYLNMPVLFGAITWNNKVLIDSIQVLQSKAAKLVLDRSPYSSSSEALSDPNWMNLSVRRQKQRCIHMYNLVNDNSRNDIIVRGQDYLSYNTRSKEIIRTTKSICYQLGSS